VGLDGDAALAFKVHGVEDLGLHLAGGQRAGQLEEPVGEGGLAVVDMRDDREVADVTWIHFVAGRPQHPC
jgi:methenyltetrahydromethanopterin cyclohydrolase